MIYYSKDELIRQYIPLVLKFEGSVNHFYLDTQGNVTIGCGHLVNDPAELAKFSKYFYTKYGVGIVEFEDVIKDYTEVSVMPYGNYKPIYYDSKKRLVVSSEGIFSMLKEDISEKIKFLTKQIPGFREFPINVQLVLLDIAFNSGQGHLAAQKTSKKHGKNRERGAIYFQPIRNAIYDKNWLALEKAVTSLDKHLKTYINSKGKVNEKNSRYDWRELALSQVLRSQTNFLDTKRQISHIEDSTILARNICMKSFLLNNLKANNVCIATIPFAPINTTPNQSSRPLLKLQTPLPAPLTITQLTGHEALSQPYKLHITVYAQNTAIQAKQLLMKPVSIKLDNKSSNLQRYFHGIVSRFVPGKIQDGWRQYTLEIVPAISLLNWETDCRIFRNMSVLEILRAVLNVHHIQMDSQQVKRILPKRDYCVQYQETTLNFIQRLLEQEGIYYYFVHHENNHVLTLGDHERGYYYNNKPVLQYIGQGDTTAAGELHYWEKQANYYAGEFVHGDYDFTTPDAKLTAQQSQSAKLKAASKAHWYEHPGYFADQTTGKTLAQLRADALEAWHEWIEAASETPLMPGQVFNVSAHPDTQQQGDYIVTSAYHYLCDQSHHYQCVFKALPANLTARPLFNAVQPKIHGHQTALVVGDGQDGQEAHIDKYGRVCVRFHWEREQKNSCWVRVAQRWAGKQWGMVFHPRLGQEVIVTFEHGDPDRPLIIGSVYNAHHKPPYELPAHQTRSGIKTRSTKKGAPAQANELYFEDQQSAENIYWHAQKDFTRVIEHNEQVTIQSGNQHTKIMSGKSSWEAAKTIALKVGDNTVQITLEGIFINGQQIKFAKA